MIDASWLNQADKLYWKQLAIGWTDMLYEVNEPTDFSGPRFSKLRRVGWHSANG